METAVKNERRIWDRLIVAGLTFAGVAGLMGNLYAESGLNPINLENQYESKLGFTDESYTAAVDDGSYQNFDYDAAGYGLAQWTYHSRKRALLTFVKGRGCSIGDLDAQLDYLIMELHTYSRVWDVLTTTNSVQEASDIVMVQFERPADVSASAKAKRAELGSRFYSRLAGQKSDVIGVESKTVDQLAAEVLDGKWGNGAERKQRLEAAGYDYAEVQTEVNRRLDSGILHLVNRGETLSGIAGSYSTTVSKIVEDNKKKYPALTADYIMAGWVLMIR